MDHPSPYHSSSFLLCPEDRRRYQKEDYILDDAKRCTIIENSYCSSAPQGHHHIRPLHGCNNKEGEPNGFICDACFLTTVGTTYYFCDGCNASFHKECVEAPAQINVPGYHPKHPLQLLYNLSAPQCEIVSHCCESLNRGYFYYCSICGFSMHPVCASKPKLLTIDHPKCHEHTLMYFHRKASLICDVCGFDDERYFIYICLQCDFVIHKMCIYLPRVIIVSRHDHRLSIISALPCENRLCGVCHKQMNGRYGGYICMKGCEFVVHCPCATQPNVWDGRELEGKPDEYEDITSFKKLNDGKIQYFYHPDHPLRLCEKIDGVYDVNTYCQACIRPLLDENVYQCEDCDFILHQTCADLPLKKRHLLHIHPLILQKNYGKRYYDCQACWRHLTGFGYVCSQGCDFNIHIRCSMVSEPFNHPCHPHPLFIFPKTGTDRVCYICGSLLSYPFFIPLDCIVCSFRLCFSCASLPYKLRYKHDDHLLELSDVDRQFGQCWCEICEQMIGSWGFYACRSCSITLHITCTIGDLYEIPSFHLQYERSLSSQYQSYPTNMSLMSPSP